MMEGKKIIIGHKWNTSSVAQQTVAMAKELSKKNDVIFLAQNRIEHGSIVFNNRLKIVQWPNERPTTLKDFLFYCKLLKDFKPDISIAHFGAVTIMSIGGWLLKTPKRIAWYHTISNAVDKDAKVSKYKSFLQRWVRKYVYRLNTEMVSVSKAAGKDLSKRYSFPAEKISCVYNAAPSNEVLKQCIYNNKLIRFLGKYDQNKGVDILIDAASIVLKQYPQIIFELSGGGGSIEKYREMVVAKNLSTSIFLNGPINHKDVSQYMSEAYVTVVPSLFEAFGMIVIESFSVGTPVIGSNTGGIAEVIKAGQTGLLFEVGNAQQLASCIIKLLNDPEMRDAFSKNALMDFNERFSIQAHMQSVISLLDKEYCSTK